ncbi:hypothetical protein [Streptacidiphilus sp. PAMC 29251]
MTATASTLALSVLTLITAALLALVAAIAAAALARMDGSTIPMALARAGKTFAGTLTLLTALVALGASILR